jgi:hypothetical protein
MPAYGLMRMGRRVVVHSLVSSKASAGDSVPGEPREPAVRFVARFVIAMLVSGGAALWWWDRRPRQLHGVIDIVGYPTFGNFNYVAPFTAYHLAVYAFPIGVLIIYSLLAWRGPLRRPVRSRRPAAIEMREVGVAGVPVATPVGQALSLIGRLILPAGVVVLEASTHSTLTPARIDGFAIICGLCYLAGVFALAGLLIWRHHRAGALVSQARKAIAEVNGVAGAAAAVAGLWFVSRHSVVLVHSDHAAHRWPWLPWWLALCGVLAILGWAAWRLRAGVNPVRVEGRLLTVVVGAVLVFLTFSALPGQLSGFQGFDDAQSLVGANLLAHGLFPWRDQLFIHGLYVDVLQGNIGFALFGDTRWAGVAVLNVVLSPLSWVVLYLFVAWLSRRNKWFLVGFVVLMLAGLLDAPDGRFILVPAVLVLLGETLRRQRLTWCITLTSVLFIQAVLVPETAFLVIPALLTVLAADLVHRDRAEGLWRALRRSRWCAQTGVLLIVTWCGFLAVNHALGPFVNYYRIFGPGHNAAGVIPDFNIQARHYIEFGLGIVLVLLTFLSASRRFRARRAWTERDWVTVAAAGFVALYGEKALGRFDGGHVNEVFTATLPLSLLWTEQALSAADRLLRQVVRSLDRVGRHVEQQRVAFSFRNPATLLAVLLLLITLPVVANTPWLVARVKAIPQQHRAFANTEPSISRLGYAVPGTVDIAEVRDLGKVLDTYAGQHAPVFDMTNSLGYFYYLLDRRPGTRFVHVSMAEPPFAQEILINELKRSRPPVVIFDGSGFGLPGWDGIFNNVRHYLVSQYLLDGWQPLLRMNNELLLLRRDLMAARPPIPPLKVPPLTTDLWFSGPQCGWGSVPNFLDSAPSGRAIDIPVTTSGRERLVNIRGWALDEHSLRPAYDVVLVYHGTVVASVIPNLAPLHMTSRIGARAGKSGFYIGPTPVVVGSALPVVLALTTDGLLHPVGRLAASSGLTGSLRMPNGSMVTIGAPTPGAVQSVAFTSANVTVSSAKVPDGVNLANFDLLTFHAPGNIGPADLTVSDTSNGGQNREITAHALASSAGSLSVRVGSCLQWHGYRSKTLYVLQTGGSPVTGLRLSGAG